MSATRKRGRTVVVRNGRRYAVCGLRFRPAVDTRAPETRQGVGLLPGAALVLVAVFCVFLLRWPPAAPSNPQQRAPLAAVDRFTIEDFANANR